MTSTRAQEFAEAWNGGDAAASRTIFAESGVTHASVGLEPRGASFVGRAEIERRVAAFFARFPGGRFETLRRRRRRSFEGDQVKVKNTFRRQRG